MLGRLAFTSVSMSDWKYYLNTRKREGFNAIQINILRQYDSTKPIPGRDPFPIRYHDDGTYEYDYSTFNEEYFDNAEKMLKEMRNLDMTPILVLLWGNLVPNTWITDPNGFMARIPKPQTIGLKRSKLYVTYVINRFKKYHLIYFVTGDAGFDKNNSQDPEIEEKYYQKVVRVAKSVDSEGIYSFHINGESKTLPESLAKQAQFFSFQSGHGPTGEKAAVKIPLAKRSENYNGPIIDVELCYEGQKELGTLKPYDWRECLKFRGAENDKYFLVYNSIANPVDLSKLDVKGGQCKVIDLHTLRQLEGSIEDGIVTMESLV